MNDLHTTTLPPTTTTTLNDDTSLPSRLSRLTNQRTLLLAHLDSHFSVLKLNRNSTMSTPLVDPQGFPRSDIDVAAVRSARVQIIRLRNDLKDLEKQLEKVVHEGLARGESLQVDSTMEEEQTSRGQREDGSSSTGTAFARVDAVAPSSPAQQAGLIQSDLLVSIGSINSSNHDQLRAVGQLVSNSQGQRLPVIVSREGKEKRLELVPRSGWGGRGLLGCHIVPYP